MPFMYCKLFASLYQGTLRGLSHPILVFTNLLAHCDKDGFVDKHFRAIADEVGLTVEEVKAAIAFLESPDDESRSKEEGGRRLLRINDDRAWGWQVVNYAKYRAIRTEEDRREQNRLAQKRFRDKQKSADVSDRKQPVSNSKPSVSSSKQPSAASSQVEGEGEAKADAEGNAIPPQPPRGSVEGDDKASTWNPTPDQILVASFFNRRPSTRWSDKELKAWKSIQPLNPEDLELMSWFYTKSGNKYLRHDLQTLLNNWTAELDRARKAKSEHVPRTAAVENGYRPHRSCL